MTKEIITPEDFVAWKRDHVTVALFATLQKLKQTIEEELLSTTHLLDDKIVKKSARLLGQLEGLGVILDIECADITEEAKNEA